MNTPPRADGGLSGGSPTGGGQLSARGRGPRPWRGRRGRSRCRESRRVRCSARRVRHGAPCPHRQRHPTFVTNRQSIPTTDWLAERVTSAKNRGENRSAYTFGAGFTRPTQTPDVGRKSLTYPLGSAVLDSKIRPAVSISGAERGPDNRRAGAGSYLHPVGSSGGASEYFAFEPG